MKKNLSNFLLGLTLVLINAEISFAQDSTIPSGLSGLLTKATNAIDQIIIWGTNIAGTIIVLMVVWGGLQYIQSDAEGGKKTLTAAIIGAVIVLLARIIVSTLQSLASSQEIAFII